jgi:rhodanese-related sulfurtransferase
MPLTLPELIQQTTGDVRTVDIETAQAEMAADGGVLIDVREAGEVAAAPTPGATPIPRGVLEIKIHELADGADMPIYLHCASGGRARLCAAQLKRMGYMKVTAVTCPADRIRTVLGGG